MNANDHDERLREAFARLRQEVESRVPGAARLLVQTPATRHAAPNRLALSAALGAVLLVALVAIVALQLGREPLTRATRHPLTRAAAFEGYPWRGPTDFLLDLPGAELTRTTPSFDGKSAWLPALALPAPTGVDSHRGGRSLR